MANRRLRIGTEDVETVSDLTIFLCDFFGIKRGELCALENKRKIAVAVRRSNGSLKIGIVYSYKCNVHLTTYGRTYKRESDEVELLDTDGNFFKIFNGEKIERVLIIPREFESLLIVDFE